MKRSPPSLRLSWTLNLNYKVGPSNNLDPFFFLSYLASLTILSISSSFVYLCMYFLFGFVLLLCIDVILSILLLCFVTTPCYYCFTLLLAPPYYHSALLFLWAPPCYCCELHLANTTSSTLLLFWAPPCYMLHLAIVVLTLLPLCLAFCLSCCHLTLMLLHLCYFFACFKYQWPHLKFSLLPCLPYCSSTLLLSLASCVFPADIFTLPFFLIGFDFWSLKKQTTTN